MIWYEFGNIRMGSRRQAKIQFSMPGVKALVTNLNEVNESLKNWK